MSKEEAKRDAVDYRYDILDSDFLHVMAKIAAFGAKKYGEFDWHKSRLTRDKSPINHIYKHLMYYRSRTEYDHSEVGVDHKIHLASIAFNAMMEFYYACGEDKDENRLAPATLATEKDK